MPSIAPGELFGYIPLDAFGDTVTPIGDEQIINFNVPSFVFAGQAYSTIGIDSNGYIVVGGGTAEDNNCCNLSRSPNPARPNNVLAPFWTDLDGTGAPGILAVLTDGVSDWIVVEWRVNVFGTTSSALPDLDRQRRALRTSHSRTTRGRCRPIPTARTSWSARRTSTARDR